MVMVVALMEELSQIHFVQRTDTTNMYLYRMGLDMIFRHCTVMLPSLVTISSKNGNCYLVIFLCDVEELFVLFSRLLDCRYVMTPYCSYLVIF